MEGETSRVEILLAPSNLVARPEAEAETEAQSGGGGGVLLVLRMAVQHCPVGMIQTPLPIASASPKHVDRDLLILVAERTCVDPRRALLDRYPNADLGLAAFTTDALCAALSTACTESHADSVWILLDHGAAVAVQYGRPPGPAPLEHDPDRPHVPPPHRHVGMITTNAFWTAVLREGLTAPLASVLLGFGTPGTAQLAARRLLPITSFQDRVNVLDGLVHVHKLTARTAGGHSPR